MFSEELDIRSRWMGLKMLRKGYTPTPYHRTNKEGKHIEMGNRAEGAATYLATTQWGSGTDQTTPLPTSMIIRNPVEMEIGRITKEETTAAIKKLKNYKCGGPDETTMELFKALQRDAPKGITTLMNK